MCTQVMIFCWSIWKTQNEKIFQDSRASVFLQVRKIYSLSLDVSASFVPPGEDTSSSPQLVWWSMPSQGCIKINTDGSGQGNPSKAGYLVVFCTMNLKFGREVFRVWLGYVRT
uniref:Uncharacterized protein n=1 Tax=Rhizophora mucronata TaxID=61149 RepID=A0A2P2QT69_RHIMU